MCFCFFYILALRDKSAFLRWSPYEAVASAISVYKSLTSEDRALFDDLYYNDLLAKYNALYPID